MLIGSTEPDQGLRASKSTLRASILQLSTFGALSGALLGGLLLGLLGGLVGGLLAGLFGPLFVMATGGFDDGGAYVVLQLLRRRALRREGSMAADPVEFFDWAVDRRVMRRVGGGYQFRHQRLHDVLAEGS